MMVESIEGLQIAITTVSAHDSGTKVSELTSYKKRHFPPVFRFLRNHLDKMRIARQIMFVMFLFADDIPQNANHW